MPRAPPRSASKASAKEEKPYSKPSEDEDEVVVPPKRGRGRPPKDGKAAKASHLYTDDNPSTTIQGTGFKDAAKAEETLKLVSKRSLLYQWQTINTLYNRAKHHPHSDNNNDIQAAMKVFKTWLDDTYPNAKEEQTQFPVLKKDVVKAYLPKIRDLGDKDATAWAEKYARLPKAKRLANTLMDDSKPEERDMGKVRQDALEQIVREQGGEVPAKDDEGFMWDGDGLTEVHLLSIAYAFTPSRADVLMKKLGGKK